MKVCENVSGQQFCMRFKIVWYFKFYKKCLRTSEKNALNKIDKTYAIAMLRIM